MDGDVLGLERAAMGRHEEHTRVSLHLLEVDEFCP